MIKKKVFISSTSFDLKDLRAELAEALKEWGYLPIWNESPVFPKKHGFHSHDICLDAVKECDIYLLIIDRRYGGIYAGENYPKENISITWYETKIAVEEEKEMFIFVRDEVWNERPTYKKNLSVGISIKPHHVDDSKVFNFIEYIVHLSRNNWRDTFKNSVELKGKLKTSLNVPKERKEFAEKPSLRVEDCLIGKLDAWSEDKDFLIKNFILVAQFSELSEHDKCFLFGRRGAGKSAIAIMLEKKEIGYDHCIVIPGEVYTYGNYIALVENLEGSNIDIKMFIRLLWRYVLRIVIMQGVVDYVYKNMVHKKEVIKIIEKYLEDRGFSTGNIGLILLKVFDDLKVEDYKMTPITLYKDLQYRCETVEFKQALSLIQNIMGDKKILIVLDTLESYRIYSDSMNQGLRGIIEEILNILRDRDLSNIGIRFFMPAEIYEDISAEIPAKTKGSTVFLRWQFSYLVAMLSKRFIDMLKRTDSVDKYLIERLDELVNDALKGTAKEKRALRKSFWYDNNFLPSTITNKNKDEEDCFAYILRHTQRRPRELILILNQIIRKAFEKDEFPYLSEKSVRDGLHERETIEILLRDSLSPFEGYINKFTDRARTAFWGMPRVMSGIQLKQFAKALYDVSPIKGITPVDFVNYLLRAGVIGHILDTENCADKSGYCKAWFEYLMQDHIPLNNRFMYYVHPMMGDFFNMKRVQGHGAVYPIPEDDLWLEEEIGIYKRDV